MKTRSLALRASALTGASVAQMGILALLNLLIARYLPVDDFGIVRVVTAYMIVVTLLGHFCLHDAAAAYIATARDAAEKSGVLLAATFLASAIGVTVAFLLDAVVLFSGLWTGGLRSTLAIVILCTPIVSLTTVYTSVMQAVGSYRALTLFLLYGGIVPLLIIAPLTPLWGLGGWTAGRVISYAVLLVCSVLPLRELFRQTLPLSAILATAARLFRYARVQVVSGVLSMALQSADVIALERIDGDLGTVAMYGLASLFTRPLALIPAALGRVLFRDIALGNGESRGAAAKLLSWTAGSAIAISAVLAVIVPTLIRGVYGRTYEAATVIVDIMLVGVVFNCLWTALSTINVATKRPDRAVAISATGAATACISLIYLIPKFGAIGAAWAMNIAYVSGTAVGLWQLYGARQRNAQAASTQSHIQDPI